MKKIITLSALLLTLATTSFGAGTNDNSWVLTLGGAGATTTSGDSQTAFGTELSLGRTTTIFLPVEFGARQGISYSSSNDNSVVADTKLYSDVTLLNWNRLDFFVGGSVGAAYGNTTLTWVAAPEGGLRYWFKEDVAVVGRVEYPFDLNDGRAANILQYKLLFQVKF